MNRDIVELREVIMKLVPLLTGKGLIVSQRGSQACVHYNPVTKRPERVNIPCIPDNATPDFVRAIQGFVDHEVAHVLHTDWEDYTVKGDPRDRKVARLQSLVNIVEDTFIEREICKTFPGSRANLRDVRTYFLAKITEPALAAAKDDNERFSFLLVPVMRALAGHEEMQAWMDAKGYWKEPMVATFVAKLKPATKTLLPKIVRTKQCYEVAVEMDKILYPAHPAPVIEAIDPEEGSTAGGEEIVIHGKHFVDVQTVTLGGKRAAWKLIGVAAAAASGSLGAAVSGGMQLLVTTPRNAAGPVDVIVTTDHGFGKLENGFTYVTPPPPPAPSEPDESEDEDTDDDAGDGASGESDGESEDKPEKKASAGDGDGERDHEESDEDGDVDEEKAGGKGSADEDEDDAEEGDEDEGAAGASGDEDDGAAADEDRDDEGDGAGGDDTDDAEADSEEDPADGDADDAGEDDAEDEDDGDDDAGDGSPDADEDEDLDDEPHGAGASGGEEDDADGDESAAAASGEADDEEDGDGASGLDAGESTHTLSIDDRDPERAEASDSDDLSDGPGGVGGTESGGSMFDLPDDAFKDADLSAKVSILVTQEAIDAINEADYTVYTREFDRIEPLEVPPSAMKPKWVPELEDKVRTMTGRMQKDIERMLASQSYVVRTPGWRSGRLHAPALHRLASGDDRVFNRKQEHQSKDTAVMLLVDNSGSMKGSKCNTAMVAAYALSTTLERVKIAHEVLGFTTGGWNSLPHSIAEAMRTEIMTSHVRFSRTIPLHLPIYKSFDERISATVKTRIAFMQRAQAGLSGNIDGECLEYAAIRLMKRREKRKVMIVLSDGHPVEAINAPAHLKMMVEKLTKIGIDMVGIGIESHAVKSFYPNYVVLNNAEELPNEIMKQLKTILTN